MATWKTLFGIGCLFVAGVSDGFADVTVTDSTNILLQDAYTVPAAASGQIIPDVTGGAAGILVPYSEVGTINYPIDGPSGFFGVHNLNDGDVGVGNPTDGFHAIPAQGAGAVIIEFDAGVTTITGIAIYGGYFNRVHGDYVLRDGTGAILGQWTVDELGETTHYWLTFPQPVTTDRLIIDAHENLALGLGGTDGTTSFREIQVFESSVVDTDGDGIADDDDACPNSDLSLTVVIDGIDTGVFNDLFDDGCTISDLISQCYWMSENHGEFMSCVANLTNSLKAEGIISGKEKGAITKAAAKAF